ncbi:tetratricopeptide repeat protein [Seonamhaeicola aphaedonensis]|uniref:Tetratricopeptide repeat protein n=1 Tax=Seonamhaeicola aphaedonensis TaxID=1461338 RepID=A0A3D9HKI2_9FLAO|nr:tetratricopeptide repeat protein [Seonamhaeicola aphaedonensis]RED49416.1 tetratricopeptide repeat protein [Seonamhaeicola aphaedonensis]
MQHRFLCLLFSIFVLNAALAQDQKYIDSLKNDYNTMPDTYKKVQTSARLFYAEVYTNPKSGKIHAENCIALSKKINYESGETVGHFHLGVYYDLINKIDSSEYHYNKTLALAIKYNDTVMQPKSLSVLAGIALKKGDFEKAITLRNEASERFIKNKDYLSYGVNIGNKALIYTDKGDYKTALSESIKALKILDTINRETYRRADLNAQIGNIEIQRNQNESAITYFLKALATYTELNDNIYMCNTYLNLGAAYINLKAYDKAKEHLEASLKIAKTHNIIDGESKALNNLAEIYTIEEKYDVATNYLNRSLELIKNQENSVDYISILIQLAKTLAEQNNDNKAMQTINLAIKKADSIGAYFMLKKGYYIRSYIHEKNNAFKKALIDTKEYHKISDSIDNIEVSKKIEELKTIYETEKKEAQIALQNEEIKTLNVQAKNDKLTKTLYGTGMISFIVIAGLLFFGFKQRIKKNQIEREKQEAIYKQEIAFKKKELASQTLHLVQKNTFIQELKENLEKIKQSPELFKVEFRRLVMLLKKESAEDKDWEIFKSYFSEVHNNFDNKLKTVYADITEKEIRLASFLRMNLSTKEIASMLNVLPESVLKSKYRLKKKLNLDKETDLNVFLNSL